MMILIYIVQAVQTVGDVSSTTMGGFGRDAKDTELGGAIKGQGICGMIGALIGGLPTDPFSQNVDSSAPPRSSPSACSSSFPLLCCSPASTPSSCL